MKNLYLEKLKQMSQEELMNECQNQGRIMEKNHPLTDEQKSRAYMAFRFAHARGGFSEEDRNMLATAIRVLRLL